MRKKKFSKERFYRRLEAQNKKAVSKSETDWGVVKGGYSDCQIYPYFSNCMDRLDLEIIANNIQKKAEEIRANKPFFNTQNSVKQPEPKPEFVPPPPLEKIGASEPNNDSGLFGQCFLHMAAIVACALLLCGILQKLSH